MASTEGFEAFYAGTVERLLGQLLPVTGDLHEAEAVVQEALPAPRSTGRGWGTTTCPRQGAPGRPQPGGRSQPGPAPPGGGAAGGAGHLPMRQRQAIVLHHLVDLPIEEVAATLGTRPGAVKSLLARGLADRLSDAEEVRNSP